MSVVVHHLEDSRSHRVLWLLEELGVEYAIEMHRRHPKTHRSGASLRAIHPLGKAPVLAMEGKVYAESGAILETLLDRFDTGALRPAPGSEAFDRYRFFLHYAEGSLMPPMLVKLLTGALRGRAVPWLARPLTGAVASQLDANYTDPEIALQLGFLESELKSRPYLCGDEFTAADIQTSFPLEGATTRAGLSASSHPAIVAYMNRLRARPGYAAAIERGGELDMARFS